MTSCSVASGLRATPLAAARRPLTALVYDDGSAIDPFLWSTIAQFRAQGLRLAGVAQINEHRPGRRRCDMIIEELSSGNRFRISQDRGDLARGCRLDHGALAAVVIAVETSLRGDVDMLILDKFGKEEAEGRGFRDAIALAVASQVPVLIGVPARNCDAWRTFCGDEGVTTTVENWTSGR